ncbi:unannotated protein [freshwater metagenome]|uniref:Unannotated protein n=1 Tax=freshwater metagenome TaxID=449393 RepID=A0A6J6RBG2_9ZZZZ
MTGALALLAAGLVATGVSLVTGADSAPGRAPETGAASAVAGTPAPVAEAVRAPWRPGAPRRVVVPALGLDAAVVPVKAPDRTLVPPSDPQQLGWWAGGAKPGAATGSALIAGHTVHTGGGALDDLEQLRPGDVVRVVTGRQSLRYVVKDVEVYAKGTIRRAAARLFSQDVPGRLVLLTCEDWDGSAYLSNVVVTAARA